MLVQALLRDITQADKTNDAGQITGQKFTAIVELQEPLDILHVSLGNKSDVVNAARSLFGQPVVIPVEMNLYQGKVYLRAVGAPRSNKPAVGAVKAA